MNKIQLEIPFFFDESKNIEALYFLESEDGILIDTLLISEIKNKKSISFTMNEFKDIIKIVFDSFENGTHYGEKAYDWGSGHLLLNQDMNLISLIDESESTVFEFYYSTDFIPLADAVNRIKLIKS